MNMIFCIVCRVCFLRVVRVSFMCNVWESLSARAGLLFPLGSTRACRFPSHFLRLASASWGSLALVLNDGCRAHVRVCVHACSPAGLPYIVLRTSPGSYRPHYYRRVRFPLPPHKLFHPDQPPLSAVKILVPLPYRLHALAPTDLRPFSFPRPIRRFPHPARTARIHARGPQKPPQTGYFPRAY